MRCSICGKDSNSFYYFKHYKTKPSLLICSRDCYIKWSKGVREKNICPICGLEHLKRTKGNVKYCFVCSAILKRIGYKKEKLISLRKGKIKLKKGKYTRITVDIDDGNNVMDSLKKIKKLKLQTEKIIIEQSPSKKGWHITIWLAGGGLYLYEVLFLRRLLGDDVWRTFLDTLPGRQINVLFDKKEKVVSNKLIF